MRYSTSQTEEQLPGDPGNWAFVALGSNLGDSHRIFQDAVEQLRVLSSGPVRASSFLETDPVDCAPGTPPFLNAVVALVPKPGLTPESMLHALQSMEVSFGRPAQHGHHTPRTLDLDLIAFGRETRATVELTLPHPRARERRFVLQPLSELAPSLILPGQRKTVAELLNDLPRES